MINPGHFGIKRSFIVVFSLETFPFYSHWVYSNSYNYDLDRGMLKQTFTSFVRIKSVKISTVCELFQFPKNALILTDKQLYMIYMYYETKSAEDSYRQNFLSFYLLYSFKSNGFKGFFLRFIYLFLLHRVFLAMRTCSLVSASKGYFVVQCMCFSLQWLLLWNMCSKQMDFSICGHRLSCSMACGILPDQGSNPCTLHWYADSHPLDHRGST